MSINELYLALAYLVGMTLIVLDGRLVMACERVHQVNRPVAYLLMTVFTVLWWITVILLMQRNDGVKAESRYIELMDYARINMIESDQNRAHDLFMSAQYAALENLVDRHKKWVTAQKEYAADLKDFQETD
tara:strand:+ start:6795 stop:7187 length:393 start_codon:yes stop_codon:yes gene_type:complete